MRKFLAMLTLLAISTLMSCAPKANKNDVQFWSFFTGGDGNYMQQMVDKFNAENQDFKVNMTVIDWASYYTKLSTSFLSGDLPDIATSHSSFLSSIASYGESYNIEEIDPKFDWAQFPADTAQTVVLNDKHVGVPLDTHGFVFYYNPDLVAGTSLVDADGNWLANTWPALMAGLEEVKIKHPTIQPLGLNNPDVAFMWTWYSLYRQAGGVNFLNEDGTLNVDIGPATVALNALKETFDKGYNKFTYNITSDLMQEARVAVAFEGSWVSGAVRPKQPNIKIIVMPNFFGKAGAWANNHVLFFPKVGNNAVSQKQTNALKFAQWLVDNGAIWAGAGHIPAKTSVQQSEAYQNNPNAVFQDLSTNMYPWPKNKYLSLSTEGVLVNQLQLYMEGKTTDPAMVFESANKEIANLKTM